MIVPKAVQHFAQDRCQSLARKIRHQLRRLPPSGIFDFDDHRHLWDEYCLQMQDGPIELERAWSETVDPMIDHLIDQLPKTDAALLTLAQQWEDQDLLDADPEAVSLDTIRRSVVLALNDLAQETPNNWVTG